jgi:hypothetical protein
MEKIHSVYSVNHTKNDADVKADRRLAQRYHLIRPELNGSMERRSSLEMYPMRKPYTQPAIVHELELESAYGSSDSVNPGTSDPDSIDPVLPNSPAGGSSGGGSSDPPLPPKPAANPSDGGSADPPLPPKPPAP